MPRSVKDVHALPRRAANVTARTCNICGTTNDTPGSWLVRRDGNGAVVLTVCTACLARVRHRRALTAHAGRRTHRLF